MKLIRFGERGKEKPGIIQDDKWFDVSQFVKDYNEDFFAKDGINHVRKIVSENKFPEINTNERLGCPVKRFSKIIFIGLNYAKHARETNAVIPKAYSIFQINNACFRTK
jgi:2-keto-4-pentenoate hydratase/2-oxohepta-3-ene-1,7-dioic acid hydratase in catechol pathway